MPLFMNSFIQVCNEFLMDLSTNPFCLILFEAFFFIIVDIDCDIIL